MNTKAPSLRLLARLPLYLRYIKSLPSSTTNISATKMAEALGLGDVLVRKDLAKVSHGGRRKLGYIREDLIKDIESFLDFNCVTTAIVVGEDEGKLLLLDYRFDDSGLDVAAGFTLNPSVPISKSGKPIYSLEQLEDYCRAHCIHIGMITVSAEKAQRICDRLVACGIHAIWNFSPAHLKVPGDVVIQSENLSISLASLRMQMRSNVHK